MAPAQNLASSLQFSPSERETVLAIAEVAVPPGQLLPGAGARSAAKVETFFAGAGAPAFLAYRAMLHALDAGARLANLGRPFRRLAPAARLALLSSWRGGDYGRRTAIRLLVGAIKVAHFDDPALFARLGCVFRFEPPPQAELGRGVRERTTAARELVGETLEADVVVVGSGAGGAVVAKELAEQGLGVVLLEEGEYFTRADFTGRTIDMQRLMFRDMGATVTLGNVAIPVPIGRTVGGSTTINSGTCYRAPERIFRRWREEHGLDELSSASLDPYYSRVESVLGVSEARGEFLGGIARVIARGCDALGYHHHGALRRNAPDCDGKGVCCFGCPTDAKRSMNVSYVPLALRAGATLVTGAKVERILVESGRAVGVVVRGAAGEVTVRARAVVIACGSLLTPLLLMKNGLGNGSGELGKNLTIHPAVGSYALFDERIDGANAIPQGYAIEEFHDEGMLFEGAFAPLDGGSASITLLGPRFTEVMEAYDRLAFFGFLIEDTSRGRVRPGPGGRPLITYFLNDHDVARLKRGLDLLARIYFAAGARSVFPTVHGFDELTSPGELEGFRRARLHARDFDITAYHPLGTARLGRDPRSSVVDPDHQVHDTPGLYLVDGSVLPTSPAVNPQVTIMALATRAAERIAAHLQ